MVKIRGRGGGETKGDLKGDTYAQDDQKQEEDVGNIVELKPNVLWNKRQRGVLGGSDLVSRILGDGMAFFQKLIGERQVEKQITVVLVILRAIIRASSVTILLRVLIILAIITIWVLARWRSATAALLTGTGLRPIMHAVQQRRAFVRAALDRHLTSGPSRPLCL